MKIKHQFLIVDNYSDDGTYEILKSISRKYNIKLCRQKCKRGKGREIAMNMAENWKNDDAFMYFDGDTIYTQDFLNFVEKIVPKLDYNSVYIQGLCLAFINFKIHWRNLNVVEDVERYAHFISQGYNFYGLLPAQKHSLIINGQLNINNRESRYAKGYKYYFRKISNTLDIIKGDGINNIKKITQNNQVFKVIILKIIIKTLQNKIYPYSTKYSNWKYFILNAKYIDYRTLEMINKNEIPYNMLLNTENWYKSN